YRSTACTGPSRGGTRRCCVDRCVLDQYGRCRRLCHRFHRLGTDTGGPRRSSCGAHRISTIGACSLHTGWLGSPIMEQKAPAGGATARRILVVDDELTIAESVAARLRAEGFTVELAHDGPAAVAAARIFEPDLVVLDIMLPGFDGLEVCRRIQAERPVPVLMLTARDDETDVLVGLAVGADDYLTKPFSLRVLTARVHALLRRVER